MSSSLILALMIIIWAVVMRVLKRASGGKNAAARNRSSGSSWHREKAPGAMFGKRAARSTDGHFLSREQDITCRQFGHRHSGMDEPSMRYIVHDDPEEGYIILNGKKMLRTEADAYENTI